jgi:shikimate kinase
MKTIATLTVIAALLAFGGAATVAEAKVKFRVKDNWRLSCNTARHMVREKGYSPVRIKSCVTPVYSFYAVRKGRTYIFRVDPRTGFLWRE